MWKDLKSVGKQNKNMQWPDSCLFFPGIILILTAIKWYREREKILTAGISRLQAANMTRMARVSADMKMLQASGKNRWRMALFQARQFYEGWICKRVAWRARTRTEFEWIT
jgi:hypothetical protein